MINDDGCQFSTDYIICRYCGYCTNCVNCWGCWASTGIAYGNSIYRMDGLA